MPKKIASQTKNGEKPPEKVLNRHNEVALDRLMLKSVGKENKEA